jgi:phosphohistidine phosphatase
MHRELIILRHGKSDWTQSVDDFDRPISDRGKRSAQRIATWLLQHELLPDRVVSSPAQRAVETARKACKAMGMAAGDVHTDHHLYLASLQDLLKVLARCPRQVHRLLLVGHNPGLEELARYLLKSRVPLLHHEKLLPTAALMRLTMPDDWRRLDRGCADLLDRILPKELPELFPFPDANAQEWRERPAYYYRQSSVIPYRYQDDRLEVLVIQSSKKKHRVVPKGIHDPGMTAQESAAKEAWEEAGVEGEVKPECLGEYSYPKWGAACRVKVYGMRVTRMIEEKEWRESHRGRHWVSPEEAAATLKQPELGKLVLRLAEKYG